MDYSNPPIINIWKNSNSLIITTPPPQLFGTWEYVIVLSE